MEQQLDQKGWSCPAEGRFIPNISKLQGALEPGMYETDSNPSLGIFLQKIDLNDQKVIKFPDSTSELVIKDIQNFWAREDLFRKYSFPYKRGILLYGPPGGGKSSTIFLICKEVIQKKGIVLKFNTFSLFDKGLKLIKQVQPEIPIVVLMEDLDQIVYNENLSDILNLLDGVEKHADRVVYLATTNRPQDLQQNIKNRPSRFDRRFEFKSPNLIARKYYLASLFREEKNSFDLDHWAIDTEEFSFAHLKELFISVVLFGNNYEEVIKELRDMGNKISDENEDDE